MPSYDYRCEANGQKVEVRHGMNEQVKTWGELCALAGLELGDTPSDSPVSKLANGGQVVNSSALRDSSAPCGIQGGCSSGRCGS